MNASITKFFSAFAKGAVVTLVVVALWVVSVTIGIHMFPQQVDKTRLQVISYLMTNEERMREQQQRETIENLSNTVATLQAEKEKTALEVAALKGQVVAYESMTSMDHIRKAAENTYNNMLDTSKSAWGSVTSLFGR